MGGEANRIGFKFNAKKAAQAANKILALSGGHRNYMELVKLLFIADRESLVKLGCPITGDIIVAMRHGLVLSRILDLVRLGPALEQDAAWFDAVSGPIGYDVKSVADVGVDDLSGAELRILEDVFSRFGNWDWKQLSNLTHRFPEWSDPGISSFRVNPEQILRLEGKSDEEIGELRSEQASFALLDEELEYCRERGIAAEQRDDTEG